MRHLTAHEKMLIVDAHEYFLGEAHEGLDPKNRAVRQRVADCLKVSKDMVRRTMAHWNKHHDSTFTAGAEPRGRPPRSEAEHLHGILSDIINDRNLSKKPSTSNILVVEVKSLTGISIPARTLRKELNRMDATYIRGRSRDPRADLEGNIAYRNVYLQKKVSNLNARRYPKLPEVYLDESYYNVNHVAGSTWLLKNSPRYTASGKGQRYCIVGAGVVYVKKSKLAAEWVSDSIESWPSHYKTSEDDYHGNFTGKLFNRWFESLYGVLQLVYGSCRIHMDGASYHKIQTNAPPPSTALKADLIEWLRDQGYTAPAHYTRKQLRVVIAQVRPAPIYEAVMKARSFGHEVLYTPPYHPELQPIEMIWGALKNRIALNPAGSLEDLGEKIGEGLAAISKDEWIGAYKKIQKQEVAYLEEAQAAAPKTVPVPSRQDLTALALEPTVDEEFCGVEYEVGF